MMFAGGEHGRGVLRGLPADSAILHLKIEAALLASKFFDGGRSDGPGSGQWPAKIRMGLFASPWVECLIEG